MYGRYIPRGDAHALAWMKAFLGGIAQSPSAYMLAQADVDALSLAIGRYETALRIARTESTRTKPAVCEKDQTRNSAEQLCMVYAQQIKLNHGIGDDAKLAIGVRPINRSRQRVRCPETSPRMGIVAATPYSHTLRFGDSFIAESPRKPFGALALQLYVAVADGPVRDANEAKWYGQFTRNPIVVEFEHKDDMKKASYFGRWISRRGEVGPWSLPVSMSIAA